MYMKIGNAGSKDKCCKCDSKSIYKVMNPLFNVYNFYCEEHKPSSSVIGWLGELI